jgi:hypothetical protein
LAPLFNKNVDVEAGIPPPQKRIWVYLMPMYIWLVFMICLPHKEERFLYPIYPLLCLAGALGLSYLLRGPGKVVLGLVVTKRKNYARGVMILVVIVVALFAVLSLSRMSALIINYSAPTMVYKHLSQYELKGGHINHYPVPGPSFVSSLSLFLCLSPPLFLPLSLSSLFHSSGSCIVVLFLGTHNSQHLCWKGVVSIS